MPRKKTRIGYAHKAGTGRNKHKVRLTPLERYRLPINHATNTIQQGDENV